MWASEEQLILDRGQEEVQEDLGPAAWTRLFSSVSSKYELEERVADQRRR